MSAPTNDTAEVFRTGPFHEALSLAVSRRGLSLDRLRGMLAERGVVVSRTTLNHWQTGRSQPERPESLRGVAILEDLLRLAPGELAGLLGSPRPRGRYASDLAEPTLRLWRGYGLADLATRMRMPERNTLRRVVVDARAEIGPSGELNRWRTRQVMRATEPTDSWFDATFVDQPHPTRPEIVDISGFTPRQSEWDARNGLLLAEYKLDEELSRGETAVVEHTTVFPGHGPVDGYEVVAYHVVHALTVQAVFTGRRPARCFAIFRAKNADVDTDTAELSAGAETHITLANAPMGTHGIRWEW